MANLSVRLRRRLRAAWAQARCRVFLHRRVSGRIKLRGAVERITIHPDFRCDGDLWLGIHAADATIHIGSGVSASGPLVITAVKTITIGAGTLFGPNVLVTDHYHGDARDSAHRALPPSMRPLHAPGEIAIGSNVQLGVNVVVLSPAQIGAGAIIAANAVVKGDIAPMAIFMGVGSAVSRAPAGQADEQKVR